MSAPKDWHRFEISNPDPHGRGGKVVMDGEELKGVTKVTLEMGVNEANKVTIQMYAGSINADVPVETDAIAGYDSETEGLGGT